MTTAFRRLWDVLAPLGRDPASGGYLRYAWSEPELACRLWFAEQAAERGLELDDDGNGNLFAWWGDPYPGNAVLTGSHFDSVPYGGGYDGPLGVVSAFLAIDELRERGIAPRRPIGVAAFADEEGARFGVPCLGSRLLTGALAAHEAARLTDRDGTPLAIAMGAEPIGARPDLLGRLACYLELHIEQGRTLDPQDAPVGVATGIWPHGRWRLEFTGQGNHAGTTTMTDRHDPMVTFSHFVLAVNEEARRYGAHGTVGRVVVLPNATNAVPSEVHAWLDARAADAGVLDGLVATLAARATRQADEDGTTVTITPESHSPAVAFDPELTDRVREALRGALATEVPLLPTAAGHDAGILAAHLPTTMLFVRNRTGVSHAPAEHATDEDCETGVLALTAALEELACR